MPNGTILDLYAPGAIPAYGFNEGIVFGFRVQDIEAASAELAAAGCKLLSEITRIDEMRCAFRPHHDMRQVSAATPRSRTACREFS
jgi:hypothetical protein